MDDLISRQAAIETLRTCYDTETISMDSGDEYINYGDAVGGIEQLPPKEPEQPTGVQDILQYLDEHLHPIVSPEHWNVYSELHDMISRLLSAQPETKWIPCSEGLPKKPYGCLVTVWDTNPITMDEFENILPYFVGWDGEQWNDADGEQCPFEVIAWKPLPKPYREGKG